jgi:hypothetical protein
MKRLMCTAMLLAVMGASAWLSGCALKGQDKGATGASGSSSNTATASPSTEPRVVDSKSGVRVVLPPPSKSRNWKEVRLQAARRLIQANPDITYMGKPPDLLRAIPVLTFELNGDGKTVNIAIEAMRRAAPFGNVSHLPKPWRFNETFLFNNQHKFKPMTLDQL